MRRRPNPWIMIPSLLAGSLSATLGWIVSDVSCRVEIAPGVVQHCRIWSATVALVALVGTTIGMLVVLVLVSRSLAEYRDTTTRGDNPPGPGCEVPD